MLLSFCLLTYNIHIFIYPFEGYQNYYMVVNVKRVDMSVQENIKDTRNLADLPHVLIIDDDKRIRELVSRYLHDHNFVVSSASDANAAREMMKRFVFDALVVDIMMPGESGLDFTRSLRKENDIPVLLLTALGETDDRITGLQSGADDYLPKPFEPMELVLRLQAILKRMPGPKLDVENIRIGRWSFDRDRNELIDGEELKSLTSVEGTLLQALASQAGEVVSRDKLASMCGIESEGRAIDVQVTRLRRKIEEDTRMPRYLQTVRGKGYRLWVE
jgi:two-component system phosphate regulon response regulator OmpR